MKLFKDKAYLHSMPEDKRELQDVVILEHKDNNDVTIYVCDSGIICKGIFNCFIGQYYADDKYQVLFAPSKKQ